MTKKAAAKPKIEKEPKGGKSGIKTFKAGEVIFNENDPAQSLYIIQKGQIRLFRPKGKGFVELAILRTGEVIGEMAYFDEKASRRSCSASAIVTTEVIEISFVAFEKTMQGLNPWFRTIINTLSERLRKTNERVKELESNSIGYGQGGKVGGYKFFSSIDVIRILSMLYLVLKSSGEEKDGVTQIHMNTLKFYLIDVFNVQEIKFEEFFAILKDEKYLELDKDQDGLMKMIKVANVERLKGIMGFLNSQRRTEEDKKMKISLKCELFLKKIIDQLTLKGESGSEVVCDISAILKEFESKDVHVTDEDLKDAVTAGLCGDIIVGEANKLSSTVNFDLLKRVYPALKMQNLVEKINEQKAGGKY